MALEDGHKSLESWIRENISTFTQHIFLCCFDC